LKALYYPQGARRPRIPDGTTFVIRVKNVDKDCNVIPIVPKKRDEAQGQGESDTSLSQKLGLDLNYILLETMLQPPLGINGYDLKYVVILLGDLVPGRYVMLEFHAPSPATTETSSWN
jgi:hypothetical protein